MACNLYRWRPLVTTLSVSWYVQKFESKRQRAETAHNPKYPGGTIRPQVFWQYGPTFSTPDIHLLYAVHGRNILLHWKST